MLRRSCTIHLLPFPHGLFLRQAVPTFSQVRRDDVPTFRAFTALKNCAPRISLTGERLDADEFICFAGAAFRTNEIIGIHGILHFFRDHPVPLGAARPSRHNEYPVWMVFPE